MFNTGSKFPVKKTFVMDKIENSRLSFEITLCKLGIAFIFIPKYCTVLHCTALHCTALHCTALHCTALHCTALHCTELRCAALHGPARDGTALYCIVHQDLNELRGNHVCSHFNSFLSHDIVSFIG